MVTHNPQIGLEIPYTPVFNPTASPVALPSLTYERCGILFNLAALYSQLAAAEDRTTTQGLKQMMLYSQVRAHLDLRCSFIQYELLERGGSFTLSTDLRSPDTARINRTE